MNKSVEIYSDGICYWWRWGAVFTTCAVFLWLGFYVQDHAPAATFEWLILGIGAGSFILALVHRPRHYRILVDDDGLSITELPSERVKARFPRQHLRYVTVRNTGHLFNLSVLRIVVRSDGGSQFFGPIYKNGVDAVESAAVARLLPRLERPIPTANKAPRSNNDSSDRDQIGLPPTVPHPSK